MVIEKKKYFWKFRAQEKGNVLKLSLEWPHLMKIFIVRFKCVRVTHKAGVTIKSTLKLYTDGLSILTTVHKLESPCAGKTSKQYRLSVLCCVGERNWKFVQELLLSVRCMDLRPIVIITFIEACCCCDFERCTAVDFLGQN